MSLIFCGTWHRHNKRHIPGETVLCTYIWSLSQVKLQHNESSVRERTNPSLSPRGKGAYELNARWAKGSQVRLETGISSRCVSVRGSEMSNWPNKRHSTKAAGVCLLVSSPLCFSSINPITNATHRPQKAAHGRGTAVDRVVVGVCAATLQLHWRVSTAWPPEGPPENRGSLLWMNNIVQSSA